MEKVVINRQKFTELIINFDPVVIEVPGLNMRTKCTMISIIFDEGTCCECTCACMIV